MKPPYCIKQNFLLFFMMVLFSACSNSTNKKEQKENLVEIDVQNIDKSSIFDGKTLDGWEITQYGTQGPVFISNGNIVLDYGDGCTGITSTRDVPKMNYEVTLDARRTSGNDFFCGLTFPVDDQFCSLIVGGWGGTVVGLSNINENDAANNQTKTSKQFDNETWYAIKLKVSADKIEAWIDNEQLIDYIYKNDELSIRREVSLSKPLGICSWKTSAELRNIKLKELES